MNMMMMLWMLMFDEYDDANAADDEYNLVDVVAHWLR